MKGVYHQWSLNGNASWKLPLARPSARRGLSLLRQGVDAIRAGRYPRLHAREGDGRGRLRLHRKLQSVPFRRGERRERARGASTPAWPTRLAAFVDDIRGTDIRPHPENQERHKKYRSNQVKVSPLGGVPITVYRSAAIALHGGFISHTSRFRLPPARPFRPRGYPTGSEHKGRFRSLTGQKSATSTSSLRSGAAAATGSEISMGRFFIEYGPIRFHARDPIPTRAAGGDLPWGIATRPRRQVPDRSSNQAAADWGRRVYIRPIAEMNGHWNLLLRVQLERRARAVPPTRRRTTSRRSGAFT